MDTTKFTESLMCHDMTPSFDVACWATAHWRRGSCNASSAMTCACACACASVRIVERKLSLESSARALDPRASRMP
eukprot:1982242-Prymnesium_polylepis.1